MIQKSSLYQETIKKKEQIEKDFLAIKPVSTLSACCFYIHKSIFIYFCRSTLASIVAHIHIKICTRYFVFIFYIICTLPISKILPVSLLGRLKLKSLFLFGTNHYTKSYNEKEVVSLTID